MKLTAPPSPVDVVEWRKLPHLRKLRPLAVHFVMNGSGTPWFIFGFYVVKLAIFVGVGLAIVASTPGFSLSTISEWWHEPVVYQKVLAWTALVEALGLGASSGPLAFKMVKPFVAPLHFGRVGTIRQPPWPRVVPFTDGDSRTLVDVALWLTVIGLLVSLLFLGEAGTAADPMSGVAPAGVIIALFVATLLLGLRDKVSFLASRPDIFAYVLVFLLFPYEQAIIGMQCALALVWLGAGISKFTHHFAPVVAVMNSNAPGRPKFFKRKLYKRYPDDLRPSMLTHVIAHKGTVIEIAAPIVLLLTGQTVLAAVCVALLILLHIVILTHVPLAVPNEWNVFMMVGGFWLFWTHGDVTLSALTPGVLAYLVVMWVAPVILGSLRPDLVSFQLAMRYYAGNWAASAWCFRGDAASKLSPNIKKASPMVHEQFEMLYNAEYAEIANMTLRAWRTLHPQGRAINGLLQRGLDDLDAYQVIDGEIMGCAINGWNLGDGHLNNDQLVASVQKRCDFAPGELVVVMIESQPIHRGDIGYRIVDAALGQVEAGRIKVAEFVNRQPWTADPLPVQVTEQHGHEGEAAAK
jgi:hypothetical protein